LLHRLLFRFTLCDLGLSLLSVLGMSINLIVIILLVLVVFVAFWPKSSGGGVVESKLSKCPDCKRKISRRANPCPHCGRPKPFSEDFVDV